MQIDKVARPTYQTECGSSDKLLLQNPWMAHFRTREAGVYHLKKLKLNPVA
jgi:hypothetical protein